MQRRHHYLRRGNFIAIDHHVVNRNTAPVVDHRDRIVEMDRDFNLRGESSESFVNGIVDDFVHQVMQASSPVDPMYIAGRLRTASMPPSTLMESAL